MNLFNELCIILEVALKRSFSLIIALLFLLIGTGILFAQEKEEIGFHQHDGFYLKFQLGAGYQNLTYQNWSGSDDMEFSGFGGSFAFQIGGVVAGNFILFAELNHFLMTDPDVKLGGASGSTSDTSVSVLGVGGGFSYYIMPSNIYFSASISASRATLEISGNSGNSEYGLGGQIAVGKEWWVSKNWGLGLALIGQFSSMKDKGVDNKIYNYYTGLAFSASYN